VKRAKIVRGMLAAAALLAAGCATETGGPLTASSVETLTYYPYLVKGYENTYPNRSIVVLMATDSRSLAAGSAPVGGNPAAGVTIDQDGTTIQRLYSGPIGPIVQEAIVHAAKEAGLAATTSSSADYQAGVAVPADYVLAAKITKCWMKKVRSAGGQNGPFWQTQAEVALEVSIYKPPFAVPFWHGTSSDTYFDPPVGSFGLGPEDQAGIYDEPGEVLSVALTRAVAGIFEREDLHTLMVGDDIHPRHAAL
jgi:hypothetical protein